MLRLEYPTGRISFDAVGCFWWKIVPLVNVLLLSQARERRLVEKQNKYFEIYSWEFSDLNSVIYLLIFYSVCQLIASKSTLFLLLWCKMCGLSFVCSFSPLMLSKQDAAWWLFKEQNVEVVEIIFGYLLFSTWIPSFIRRREKGRIFHLCHSIKYLLCDTCCLYLFTAIVL